MEISLSLLVICVPCITSCSPSNSSLITLGHFSCSRMKNPFVKECEQKREWGFYRCALQVKDLFNSLESTYPHVLLFKSSGHFSTTQYSKSRPLSNAYHKQSVKASWFRTSRLLPLSRVWASTPINDSFMSTLQIYHLTRLCYRELQKRFSLH